MAEFLMKPRVDYAFKEIMMDEKARIGFLSAILKLKPEDIKETQIQNTNLRKQSEKEKLGILDVRILMNNNTEIDIEIQLAAMNIWADRALFYRAKMYTEQIRPGQNYSVFKKCVSISILDFILFEEPKNISEQPNPPSHTNFYSCFHIWEDSRHFLFTDSQKCLEYEAREKAVRDHNQMMFEAKESGKKEGIEIGKFDKSIQIAKNMLQKGLTINIIAEVTGLSLVEIEALQLKQTT